jgi:hypothetical protein
MAQQLIDAFDANCARLGVSRSERVRQLLERDIASTRTDGGRRVGRRLRRLRRCVSCSAFVRHGYTCKTCRSTLADSVVIAGQVFPLPDLPRQRLVSRPDARDPRWHDAEAVVLDAYAPIVAIVYEALTGEDSLEMTDLDDIADLLAMATTLRT